MALDVEDVVGGCVDWEKSLRGPSALETLHLALSSSGRLRSHLLLSHLHRSSSRFLSQSMSPEPSEEPLQGWPLHRAAGEAAVVIHVGDGNPAGMPLAEDIGLARLPLRIEGVKSPLTISAMSFWVTPPALSVSPVRAPIPK
jgi:hypothetical protein